MSSGEFITALAANFIVAGVVASLGGTRPGAISFGIGLVLLFVSYLMRKKKPKAQAPPPSPISPVTVHQENKQEFNPQFNPIIQIGLPDVAVEAAEQDKARRETLVMEYMQRVRSTKKKLLRNDIIAGTSLTKEEVVEATENLVRKGLVLRSTLDAPGGFVYWLDDD